MISRSRMPKQLTRPPKNPTLAAKRPNKALPKVAKPKAPQRFNRGGKAGMKGYC